MATYYVDFVGGDDTNNGTATGTPWKHCPGDSNATGNASSTTPAAGDTIIFKGAVQYDGAIALKSSGSSGNVITYDGNSAGTWGTGDAIIDGGGSLSNLFSDGYNLRQYVTIKNFLIRDTDITNTNSHGIYFYPGAAALGISIEDCEITDLGGDAIQTVGDVQIFVRRCILHDGEVDGIKGSLGDGSIIEDCDIYDFDNVTNHGDAFQVHGYSGSCTITIRYNRCWNNTQNIYLDAWGGMNDSNFNVYGNIVWKSGADDYNGIVIDTEDTSSFGTISVYNNTVVDCDSGSGGIRVVDRGGGVTTLNVKNNLFYNSIEGITVAKVGTLNRDYNLWTIEAEANDETNGQYWSGGTSLFLDYASQDFHLTQATDAGENLGSPYNEDRDNVTRGADSVWDRGAYEYGGTSGFHRNRMRIF